MRSNDVSTAPTLAASAASAYAADPSSTAAAAVSWGPIGQEVFERTYARPLPDGRTETWLDTVQRVVAGNVALSPKPVADRERQALLEVIGGMQAIPAGRHLWASGAQTTLGLFNCHRAGWDSTLSGHFGFTFDQLMLGGGVGANYSSEYLQDMPKVRNQVVLDFTMGEGHPDFEECSEYFLPEGFPGAVDLLVPDSRQGWLDALRLVIEAHAVRPGKPLYLKLGMSLIRPRGSRIHGFGGIASGPGPLMRMLRNVNELLNGILGHHLDPMVAMSLDHEIAQCVISGNVRRSARMSILHWRDPFIFHFVNSKMDHSSHWTTNISVEVDAAFFDALRGGDPHAEAVLTAVAAGMIENGEPGFYNSSLASEGEEGEVRSTNPCGEIALEEWEQCCLGHVNLAAFAHDHEGAVQAFRLMARYLIRATFAKASDPRQEAVKNRNRRIGVGFFGFHDWALLNGVAYEDIPRSPELQSRLRDYRQAVEKEAFLYAQELGIPVPVKTTTVAPTGSIAKLPGVSEGIQPPFSPYFIRRVRYASNDPKLMELRAAGYDVEPDIYSPGTEVVSFPCRDEIMDLVDPDLVKGSDEISVEGYLRVQEMVQRLFATNAISITVNFDRSNVTLDGLMDLLLEYLPRLKGITMMPEDGRPQSPYERISREDYEASAHRLVGQAMDDCATGACPIR